MSEHDPLCPYQPYTWYEYAHEPGNGYYAGGIQCLCALIDKVRSDELRNPSEDAWMSVRAVCLWEDEVRTEEREKAARRMSEWIGKRETTDSEWKMYRGLHRVVLKGEDDE